MHVAIVVQRYGDGVVGGAETHARLLAEHLAVQLKWQVSVFTTTAKDYLTWKPDFAPGTEISNEGILVHRFRVRKTRSLGFFRGFNALFSWWLKIRGINPKTKKPGLLEKLWYRLQGPYCPDLVDSLRRSQEGFAGIIYFTYLYYPTVFGMEGIRTKRIIIPTLHEERPAYFYSTRKALEQADHIAVNSEEELSLLRRIYPTQARKAQVLAIGLNEAAFLEPAEVNIADLPETYVLYLGRISKGKQVDKLIRHFETFKRVRVENDLHLVLAGQVEPGLQIPDAPFLHYLGFVSDQEKISLIRKAACIVNSSPLESLSLITLEALALGIPILINELSETLRYYMKWAPSVFGYRNESTFISQLSEITSINWREDPVRRAQLDQSRQWVMETFSWTKVIDQLQSWLNH